MDDHDEREPQPPKVVMLNPEEIRFLDDGELQEVLGGQTGWKTGSCAQCTSGSKVTCCQTDGGTGGTGGGFGTNEPGCYLL